MRFIIVLIMAISNITPITPYTVTVDEGFHGVIEVDGGDTLNISMHLEGDPLARCNDMAGKLVGSLCQSVDF